ncbi:Uncharacterised protein [Chryseobacterium gleum]|uniref:Ecotin n=1 Tax=Chryseobacterium gleum TaxID=250 RepID=A0A448B7P9_CHRGE|nr:ecotin [Chryseobacterium gleum]QQY32297.1 ecotin [Chryseobacterium gleum]VEE10496.1 Uncharacterised protein [Chryseobacterium gleum]
MKNKKLVELSKKITLGKIKKLEKQEVLTIYAGKDITGDCYGHPDCNSYCGPFICSTNDCWSFS